MVILEIEFHIDIRCYLSNVFSECFSITSDEFIINEVDANIFGEARIRVNVPLNNFSYGDQVYKDPAWIIVTLADNGFQWTQGVDGFYRVNVSLKADQYKGA